MTHIGITSYVYYVLDGSTVVGTYEDQVEALQGALQHERAEAAKDRLTICDVLPVRRRWKPCAQSR